MVTITKEQAEHMLHQIVKDLDREYFIYERPNDSCVYVHNGKPSCIIGHMLYRFGIDYRTLSTFDTMSKTGCSVSFNTDKLQQVLNGTGYNFTQDAIDYCNDIQARQDSGIPWGKCLKN